MSAVSLMKKDVRAALQVGAGFFDHFSREIQSVRLLYVFADMFFDPSYTAADMQDPGLFCQSKLRSAQRAYEDEEECCKGSQEV